MSSSNEKFERDFETFLAGDDAQLSALYGKLPHAQPDAKLDAAVLAMAHRALNPQLVATPPQAHASPARRRARWIPALSAAATAVFAIGVAVKMAPVMWTERHEPAPAGARDESVVHVRPIDAPAPAPEPPMSPPPPQPNTTSGAFAAPREAARAAAPKPATAPASPAASGAAPVLQKSVQPPPAPIAADSAQAEQLAAKKVENVASPPAAPQAFPAQPARSSSEMDAVERKQAIAEGAWHRLHDADTTASPGGAAANTAPESTAATSATAPPPPRAKTPSMGFGLQGSPAAEQRKLDAGASGSADERVDRAAVSAPGADKKAAAAAERPAHEEKEQRRYSAQTLRNARLYPESWVAAIQRLIRAGKRDEARENLDLFREKYPDYRLPADVERFARETR